MLKKLLENRILNFHCMKTSFQQNFYEMHNCVKVLGNVAKSMRIENNQIIAGYIVYSRIFFKVSNMGILLSR